MRRIALEHEVGVLGEPMVWLCAAKGLAARHDDVPLALLDMPCNFREAAIGALDAAGRRYQIAATSASLAGLRAAVDAGIALTPRTLRSAHSGIVEAPRDMNLPALPLAEFAIRLRPQAARAARDLAQLLHDGLA
jgi:hypothetical protein